MKKIYKNSAHRADLALASDGGRWLAQVRCDHQAATLKVAPLEASAAPQQRLERRRAWIDDVKLGWDEECNLVALWRESDANCSQLLFSRLTGQGWSSPTPVAAPPGQVGDFALCRATDGRLWLAMVSTASGRRQVFASWLAKGAWSFAQRISDGDGVCFAPAMCPFGQGVRAVWDARIDGRYYVFMREMDDDPVLSRRESQALVARDDTLLANCAIATLDAETSVAVWERAQAGWGRRNRVFRGGREAMTEGNFLMARRQLAGALIGPEGIAPLDDLHAALEACAPAAVRTAPRLAYDARGTLWLSWRQVLDLGEAPRHRGFHQMLSALGTDGWSTPEPLADSAGDCDLPSAFFTMAAAAAPAGSKAAARPESPAPAAAIGWMGRSGADFVCLAAELPQGEPSPAPPVRRFRTMKIPTLSAARAQAIDWLGEPYGSPRLLWGDLHRHSSLSGCRWWCEGGVEDAYRYALAAAELDFLAVTDHGWDLESPDARRQLYAAAARYNAPGLFTALATYEMSLADGEGHMVVLTAEAQPELPAAATRRQLYRALAGRDAVVVPHHMGDPQYPYAWGGHDARLSPAAEIFQPYRTAFEQPGAPAPATAWIDEGNRPLAEGTLLAAWRAGLKIGVVASSDHLSTGGAYAGLWARANTRQGILEALRLRRCYAATAKILLAFEIDGEPMGAEVAVEPGGRFAATIHAAWPGGIERAELLAGGEVIETITPKPRKRGDLRAELKLPAPAAEQFYYLRVFADDPDGLAGPTGDATAAATKTGPGHMAWSSPIWVRPR